MNDQPPLPDQDVLADDSAPPLAEVDEDHEAQAGEVIADPWGDDGQPDWPNEEVA